jgi:hypothetical protein
MIRKWNFFCGIHAVLGLLDKKIGGRRFHPLLRWHLLPPFWSNEPGTGKFEGKV